MKLKRTKLAALALTALMAVGATSLVAYASDATATDEAAVIADTNQYTLDEDSVVFTYDTSTSKGSVSYTLVSYTDSSVTYDRSTDATVTSTVTATCTTAGGVYLTAILPELNVTRTGFVETTAALGHDYTVSKVTSIVAAGCDTTGSVTSVMTCSRCGAEKAGSETTTTTAATGHTYTSTYYKAGTNTEIVNGEPELKNPTTSGTYEVWAYCTVCQKDVLISTESLSATTTKYISVGSYSNIASIDNIVTGSGTLVEDHLYDASDYAALLSIDESNIEMTNCSKSGYYYITFYDESGVSTGTKKIEVAAHHKTVVLVEFSNDTDAAKCTVTYDASGTPTVVNNSCTGTITYKEVTHCTAAGCNLTTTCASKKYSLDTDDNYKTVVSDHSTLKYVSEVSKTVAGTGSHAIDTTVETTINTLVKSGVTYYDLYNNSVVKASKYVKFSNNTSSCGGVDGTVDVTYTCTICGADVKTVTVNVEGPEHEADTAVAENIKAASCNETGSYESVVYCKYKDFYGCTKEYSRTTVLLPRTAHTNEEYVLSNGTGKDDIIDQNEASVSNIDIIFVGDTVVDPGDGVYLNMVGDEVTDSEGTGILSTVSKTITLKHVGGGTENTYATSLGVYAYVVTYCDTCGGHEVILVDDTTSMTTPITLKIKSISKEKSNGEAGSITLEATYYRNGKAVKTETYTCDYYSTQAAYYGRTETTPISGLHLDDDGVYRYYVNDAVDYTYSGIVSYQGGKFFVANGVLCSTANGLNEYNGTWYFLSQGQVQTQYTGFAEYDGAYFYIVSGVLDTTVNGLVEYDGSKFLVAEGRLINTYNGLYQDFDGDWYFLANGQLQDYTGVAMYDGAFFKLVNGVLDSTFNGTIEYDGATFNVVAGQLYDQVA